jgi:DNA repair exonuclease SbcCD ATPase subunit
MFRKLCGLDWMPEVKDMSNYLDTWNLAMKDYTKSFHDYLGLIGLVSKDEHLALIGKYKELKKTFENQAKEILDRDDRIADQKKQMSSLKALLTKQKKELENQKKMLADQRREIKNGLAAIKQLQSKKVGK